jgi:hypothetical protein
MISFDNTPEKFPSDFLISSFIYFHFPIAAARCEIPISMLLSLNLSHKLVILQFLTMQT